MEPSIEKILREIRIEDLGLERSPSVAPSTPLGEVYRLLEQENRGAVVICDGDKVEGIFTERDVLYRTVLEGTDLATPIRALMTRRPKTLPPTARLAEVFRLMTEGGHRHVPIVDEKGCGAGLVTSRDVLRFIAGHFSEAVLNLPPRLHQIMDRPEGG